MIPYVAINIAQICHPTVTHVDQSSNAGSNIGAQFYGKIIINKLKSFWELSKTNSDKMSAYDYWII